MFRSHSFHAWTVLLGISAALGIAGQPLDAQEVKPAPARVEALPRFTGRDLDGWRIVDRYVFDRHGKVTVRDGAVRLEAGAPGTAIVWTRAAPKNSYEITLEARRVEGDDFFCGLTFPVDDSHCTLILGGWGGGTTGLSNIDGFPAVENETTGFEEFRNGQWYKIRLRVTPQRIEAWVDKKQIVDVDPREKKFAVWWEQEPARPLGIATWNTTAELRGLEVKRVAK